MSGYNGPQLPPIQTGQQSQQSRSNHASHQPRLSFSFPPTTANPSNNNTGSSSPSYYYPHPQYHHPPPPPPLSTQQQQQQQQQQQGVHSPISPNIGSPYPNMSPKPASASALKRRHTLAGAGGAKPPLPYDTPTSPSAGSTSSSSDRRKTPSSWDPNDDMVLRHLKEQLKLGWKEIASHFPNRTTNACQFRWRRLMSGTLRSQNRDATPTTPVTNTSNDALTNSPPTNSTTPVTTATTSTTNSTNKLPSPQISSLPPPPPPQFVAAVAAAQLPPSPPPQQQRYPAYVHKPPSPPLSLKEETPKPWSADEDEMLRRSDLRIEELSVLLPTRTESEIRQRAYELKTQSAARRRTMSFDKAPQRPLLERPSKFFNGLKLPPPVNQQQQQRRPGTFAPALETTL